MHHSDPTNGPPPIFRSLSPPDDVPLDLVAQVRPLPAAKGLPHIPQQQQRRGWQRGGSALLSGLPLEGLGFPSKCYYYHDLEVAFWVPDPIHGRSPATHIPVQSQGPQCLVRETPLGH